jgi:hypothetical protein
MQLSDTLHLTTVAIINQTTDVHVIRIITGELSLL